jgi:hypothetical protein
MPNNICALSNGINATYKLGTLLTSHEKCVLILRNPRLRRASNLSQKEPSTLSSYPGHKYSLHNTKSELTNHNSYLLS